MIFVGGITNTEWEQYTMTSMKSEFRMVLKDVSEKEEFSREVKVSASAEQDDLAMVIEAKGYGNAGVEDGHGSPVILEVYNGSLRLVVWADINQEDPTHIIDLEGAREDSRSDIE